MSNISNLLSKLNTEDWLQKYLECLNGIEEGVNYDYDKLMHGTALKTILIPPIHDTDKIVKKNQSPVLEPAEDKELKTDRNEAITRGVEAEVSVRKDFANFGPGGIYLSDLSIRRVRRNIGLEKLLPSAIKVYKYLESKGNIEIDGIFIHPSIGFAVIEVKATSKIILKEDIEKQLNKRETWVKELFRVIFGSEIPFPIYKVVGAPNAPDADSEENPTSKGIWLLDENVLSGNEKDSQLFWQKMKTLLTQVPNKDFIQFAAVLITLKCIIT